MPQMKNLLWFMLYLLFCMFLGIYLFNYLWLKKVSKNNYMKLKSCKWI